MESCAVNVAPVSGGWGLKDQTPFAGQGSGPEKIRTRTIARRLDPSGCGSARRARLIRVHLQRGDEGFLRDLDLAEAPHLLLSRFLLVEQLALAGDVAAIAFGRHVLAQSADRLSRDHLAADRRLDRN